MHTLETLKPSILEVFYNSLFHPVSFFKRIAQEAEPSNYLLMMGGISVFFVSAIAPIISYLLKGGAMDNLFVLVPVCAVIGILVWLFMAGIFSMLTFVFTGETRFKTFLTLSALATLPWLLMPSLTLFKINLGLFGDVIGTFLGYLIWGWTVYLFALAIGATYRLSADRVIIMLSLPFVFFWVAVFWAFGFIGNVYQFLP